MIVCGFVVDGMGLDVETETSKGEKGGGEIGDGKNG